MMYCNTCGDAFEVFSGIANKIRCNVKLLSAAITDLLYKWFKMLLSLNVVLLLEGCAVGKHNDWYPGRCGFKPRFVNQKKTMYAQTF